MFGSGSERLYARIGERRRVGRLQKCVLAEVSHPIRSFVLTLFIFKAPNYVLARTLTERVV